MPGDVDKILKHLMSGDIYNEAPEWMPEEFGDGWMFPDERWGSVRRARTGGRFPSLLNWAGQWDGYAPFSSVRTGRLLSFDFNLKNYEQEIERFLFWIHPLTESWNLSYEYEDWPEEKPVEWKYNGFDVNTSFYTTLTNIDVMEESFG